MLWDFAANETARFLLEDYGIPDSMLPDVVPTFGQREVRHEDHLQTVVQHFHVGRIGKDPRYGLLVGHRCTRGEQADQNQGTPFPHRHYAPL